MRKHHTTYLLLGSNEGNRTLHLSDAIEHIQAHVGSIIRKSKIYETGAWGKNDQPDFLNQVISVETTLSPHPLLENLMAIENKMGRQRIEKWGQRLIDLDILLYEDLVVDEGNLRIPHPGIPFRRFTLVPLKEMAPDLLHPLTKTDISTLLKECPDQLPVKVFS